MRKSDRLRSRLSSEHNIPDDLPAPSTSRPLLPRSRAASLASRSASRSDSRPASRGSQCSNSSRRSFPMGENAMPGVIASNSLEPITTSSSSSLNITVEDREVGDSVATSLLKRRRSDSDIVAPEGNNSTILDLSQPASPNASSLGEREEIEELSLRSPDIPETTIILDIPERRTPDLKGKNKSLGQEPKLKKPKEELLGSYSCPICFSPPTNATLTPCGHICCGLCLFMAVKTTMQRATTMMAPEGAIPRCPVCRATIPGWDGKGGGVIGLKARAILTL